MHEYNDGHNSSGGGSMNVFRRRSKYGMWEYCRGYLHEIKGWELVKKK